MLPNSLSCLEALLTHLACKGACHGTALSSCQQPNGLQHNTATQHKSIQRHQQACSRGQYMPQPACNTLCHCVALTQTYLADLPRKPCRESPAVSKPICWHLPSMNPALPLLRHTHKHAASMQQAWCEVSGVTCVLQWCPVCCCDIMCCCNGVCRVWCCVVLCVAVCCCMMCACMLHVHCLPFTRTSLQEEPLGKHRHHCSIDDKGHAQGNGRLDGVVLHCLCHSHRMMAVHFAALDEGRVEVDVVWHDHSPEDADSLQYTVALDLYKPVHGGAMWVRA